jgi:segregation and condensation protein B
VSGAEEELPALGGDAELDAAIEAVLMVVDAPVPAGQLAEVLEEPVARVGAALERLAASYADRGFELRVTDEGWRYASRARFAPYVERFVLDGQRSRLTRAALETLAVVAYRQPVTRSRVAAVRGVNVDGVMRTLAARGLIVEAGLDASTGGTLYRTTELFLERLGLASLEDLPPIAPLLPEVDDIDEL